MLCYFQKLNTFFIFLRLLDSHFILHKVLCPLKNTVVAARYATDPVHSECNSGDCAVGLLRLQRHFKTGDISDCV